MLPESCRLTFLTTLTLVLSLTQVQAAPLCPLSSLGQVWCERSQSCLSIKDYLNSCLVNTSLRIPSTFDDNKTRLSEDVSKLEGSESEIYQTLKEAFEKIQERQSEEEETGTKRLQGSAVDSQRELPHSLIEENDTPLKSAAKFKESHDVAGTFNEWDVKTAQGLAISSKAVSHHPIDY
jgi:hypothetical protein